MPPLTTPILEMCPPLTHFRYQLRECILLLSLDDLDWLFGTRELRVSISFGDNHSQKQKISLIERAQTASRAGMHEIIVAPRCDEALNHLRRKGGSNIRLSVTGKPARGSHCG